MSGEEALAHSKALPDTELRINYRRLLVANFEMLRFLIETPWGNDIFPTSTVRLADKEPWPQYNKVIHPPKYGELQVSLINHPTYPARTLSLPPPSGAIATPHELVAVTQNEWMPEWLSPTHQNELRFRKIPVNLMANALIADVCKEARVDVNIKILNKTELKRLDNEAARFGG